MKTNYLLLDFENVQPKNFALLNGTAFKAEIVHPASQVRREFVEPVGHCTTAPFTMCSRPTLDRHLLSLPLQSVAVKRGSA